MVRRPDARHPDIAAENRQVNALGFVNDHERLVAQPAVSRTSEDLGQVDRTPELSPREVP